MREEIRVVLIDFGILITLTVVGLVALWIFGR